MARRETVVKVLGRQFNSCLRKHYYTNVIHSACVIMFVRAHSPIRVSVHMHSYLSLGRRVFAAAGQRIFQAVEAPR